jgi:hypothetical protein
MLPPDDSAYLRQQFPDHVVELSGGVICITVQAFPVGAGFRQTSADLLLRLAPGYPDVAPDMWWFSPAIQRLDGRQIVATQSTETYFNRPWQRWSRHLGPGQWRSGTDGLQSYLSLVRRELSAAATKAAA